MAQSFLSEDFLLQTDSARSLYHDYAKSMPIYDYHCHLSPKQIANNKQFENLTQIWLYGDHYKWRAMRTNGVDERYCTGDASDSEKFEKWAETVPHTMRNPLYHWTHLELKRYFGIQGQVLNPSTAKAIYEQCNTQLATDEFRTQAIMKKMNVKMVGTTDDPIDDLADHIKIAQSDFDVKVLPTFRPDKAMAVDDQASYNQYIDALGKSADINISTYADFVSAMEKRHQYFHDNGCRVSDHGLEVINACADDFTEKDINDIFAKIRGGNELCPVEVDKFKSAALILFAHLDHGKKWVQQFHLGALRNNNIRLLTKLGPDTGFDSIGDFSQAVTLSRFLNKLDATDQLAKTIIYNLNPADNEVIGTMIGNFQDGTIAGKVQFGSGWWFLDQKDGMEKQINALSCLGLLSRFVGMLTDSRSFLSYPRHEYFRRILCNLLGSDIENGELPNDLPHIGKMVQDISANNAKAYFGL